MGKARKEKKWGCIEVSEREAGVFGSRNPKKKRVTKKWSGLPDSREEKAPNLKNVLRAFGRDKYR